MTNNVGFRTGLFGSRPYFLWTPTDRSVGSYTYPRSVYTDLISLDAPLPTTPLPLLLYMHGENADGLVSAWLAAALVRQLGVAVASTTSSDTAVPSFGDPSSWNPQTCWNRHDDNVALMDWAATQIPISSHTVMGHSLGGLIALLMSGASSTWNDPRIGYTIGLSPYNATLDEMGGLPSNVRTPIHLQGGTRDIGITPTLPKLLRKLNPPKSLFIVPGAGHLAWTNPQCRAYPDSATCVSTDGIASSIMKELINFLTILP